MMTFDKFTELLESVPSIVILLAAVFFVFVISLHDLESSILPANSKKLYFNSIATMSIYLLGFIPGVAIANEQDMYLFSKVLLYIALIVLVLLIFVSKNRSNLFKDKIFSVFKSNSCFLLLLTFLPILIGLFSYFVLINGELYDILFSLLVLIILLLFIGKASVHNGLNDSIRRFYFYKENNSLFNKDDLRAYLISENESFFFLVPVIENENKVKEKKKEESIIAINKSLVSHYEIASLKSNENK